MSLIYVVEDDSNIREIETFALKNSGYSVAEFECAKDFYKRVAERVPNLIILDIMLPDDDGLNIVKKLRSNPETKRTPVILVTAKTSEIDMVKGLDVGADDYITKPFGVMELIARVKAILRRSDNQEEKKLISFEDIFIDGDKHMVYIKDEPCELTYKEFELLKLLINNAGIVMTRDIIMERVWDTDFEGESRTLDMHIKNLRQKIKNSKVTIKTVRNVGYLVEKED
ncbi:MAG: response regulator transcription factor [Thermoflexaceae bacterium]|nr:response regulator transcription factor [Thermoflexaceae bacterium]